ncbi:hypothetical protein DFH94DRAFT_684627 [Russula ochroleuca]|uniref:Helitron helicase-like domain-containing protein n=1 Tax=Russula ochroleuca TaxID=152965 RepID=A0A9P5MQX7_9AGAM|nr:hypothetical protein DFH94DRAFT_684627 [Russula ochroleuca]
MARPTSTHAKWGQSYKRSRLCMTKKHFMVPLLGVRHFWYCFEWQERGSGHIHGFLWLKDAPKADEIHWDLLKRPDAIIPDEQANMMHQFIEYWSQIITASSPFPCLDDNMPLLGEHPYSKGRVRFEPEHNDRLMNPYNVAMILGWRANIDLKPVLSKEAAINYIAKYASKAEKEAPAFPELLAGVVNEMEGEGTAQLACKKMLNKMLGERTYSAQETAHLLLGIPLVHASTTFQTIYISAEGGFRELGTEEDAMANGGEESDGCPD